MGLPTVTTVYHNYTGASQEFWFHNKDHMSTQSSPSAVQRLRALMELDDEKEGTYGAGYKGDAQRLGNFFGIGSQRSLEQFVQWSGVDLGTHRWRTVLQNAGWK